MPFRDPIFGNLDAWGRLVNFLSNLLTKLAELSMHKALLLSFVHYYLVTSNVPDVGSNLRIIALRHIYTCTLFYINNIYLSIYFSALFCFYFVLVGAQLCINI